MQAIGHARAVSDYRDDRAGLRERNAELEEQLERERVERERVTTELATRERELAELRSLERAAHEQPVIPVKRDVDPRALMQMRTGEQTTSSRRPLVIGALALALLCVVSAMYSDRATTVVHIGTWMAGAMLIGVLLMLAIGWPRKD